MGVDDVCKPANLAIDAPSSPSGLPMPRISRVSSPMLAAWGPGAARVRVVLNDP